MAAFCPEELQRELQRPRPRSSSRSLRDPEEMTYDTLVTDFMLEVAAKRPNLMNEISDVYTHRTALEDMFKFMWNLDEAKNTLTPILKYSKKVTKASYKKWMEGKSFMNSNDRDHALKFLNRSLMEAPHPVVTVANKQWGQEQDDIVHTTSPSNSPEKKDPYKEDGWGDYNALAHSYEARAHLLFSLKQYKKCKEDIDRVLALGCPLPVEDALKNLKEECDKLGPGDVKQTERLGNDNSVAFMFETPEPPILVEPSPSHHAFSSAVKPAYDDTIGRHMVANRDIETGEIVAVDNAYSAVIQAKYLWEYCTFCQKRTLNPLPCPSCTKVVFCSEKCRSDALAGCHKVECPILPTLIRLQLTNTALLTIRMFADMGYHNLKSKVPLVQSQSRKQRPLQKGRDSNGVYDSANYCTVYNLATNKLRRGTHDLLKRTMEAFVLLKLLILSGEFFVDESGKEVDVTEDDLVFTGAMLMHHIMIVWCNADTIGEMQHEEVKSTASPIVAYGTALFPSTSLLNHACYSTCAAVSYGRKQVMVACRRIPAGTEITRQYANLYQRSLKDRESILLARYHFFCHCDACRNDWPRTLSRDLTDQLRCVVCSKAVPEETKRCPRCETTYDRAEPIDGRPGLSTYDYTDVKNRLDQAMREYMLRVPHFMDGTDTAEDVKALKELLHLYDSYVVLPTHGHITTQSLLHAVRLREGNSAFVSVDTDWQGCAVS